MGDVSGRSQVNIDPFVPTNKINSFLRTSEYVASLGHDQSRADSPSKYTSVDTYSQYSTTSRAPTRYESTPETRSGAMRYSEWPVSTENHMINSFSDFNKTYNTDYGSTYEKSVYGSEAPLEYRHPQNLEAELNKYLSWVRI